ncbi:MAG TPA: inositol monophosphatase [Ktedonobacteraceae bacterium]|nr:inositol monophosphatase [Ktedonobacteraceae bacterium]
MIRHSSMLLSRIRAIHAVIRDKIIQACEQMSVDQLTQVVGEQAGDTIFAIDRISEEVLLSHFAQLANEWSFVLIAEGLGQDGIAVFPEGTDPEQAELRIIIDPIDGTRGLMYQKRPAWILTGVAPNRGPATNLAAIELAVQTEVPLVKQHLSDSFWAYTGQGCHGERYNRLTGQTSPLQASPSRATTIAQGFGGIARFFPGERARLAAVDDAVVEQALGPLMQSHAPSFEDQYICTGGQLYELLMGHDRWLADVRPLVFPAQSASLCCHPYDLCTELIAREAGILITDHLGQRLSAPLDVTTSVAWMGFANAAIYQQIAPLLQKSMRQHRLIIE